MEKAADSSIFVNDGSFLERFKQLQEEKGKEKKSDISDKSESGSNTSVISTPKTLIGKMDLEFKANCSPKTTQAPSSGKLAFSLKQKSKIVAPSVKLGEDEDEDEKDAGNLSDSGPMKLPKLDQRNASEQSSKQVDVAPPSPSDPTVKKVADKLASFVAKRGRQFEHITRQKNPGDTPFKNLQRNIFTFCSQTNRYFFDWVEGLKVSSGRDGDVAGKVVGSRSGVEKRASSRGTRRGVRERRGSGNRIQQLGKPAKRGAIYGNSKGRSAVDSKNVTCSEDDLIQKYADRWRRLHGSTGAGDRSASRAAIRWQMKTVDPGEEAAIRLGVASNQQLSWQEGQ
ncbi:SURP and G-patch domain-containing 1 [Olea europaea subsp. europaea]|uniref:SURP and G-patch domain-containing 1 n=1 Tax=Olea europaea subsp. europaea TaxID=158383 RepID=A0A8S0R3Q3_OLEEU|nr:SURP and G-patch domain-containing 1 [Olea europaea subsp. europaea]